MWRGTLGLQEAAPSPARRWPRPRPDLAARPQVGVPGLRQRSAPTPQPEPSHMCLSQTQREKPQIKGSSRPPACEVGEPFLALP